MLFHVTFTYMFSFFFFFFFFFFFLLKNFFFFFFFFFFFSVQNEEYLPSFEFLWMANIWLEPQALFILFPLFHSFSHSFSTDWCFNKFFIRFVQKVVNWLAKLNWNMSRQLFFLFLNNTNCIYVIFKSNFWSVFFC